MILRRYLVRQVVSTSLVVSSLLTLVFMGAQLVKFFGRAAEGRMDASILFSIVALRFPDFLTLILPLGFFIGLMLVFGRLYVDHEMAVLNSSGISRDTLGIMLVPLTLVMVLVEGSLLLGVSPWCIRKYDEILNTQLVKAGFDLIKPREFVSREGVAIYAGSFSEDKRSLKDIFYYQASKQPDKPDRMIIANSGAQVNDKEGESKGENRGSMVDLRQGRQYQIFPQKLEYSHAEFDSLQARLDPQQQDDSAGRQSIEGASFSNLLKRSDDPHALAEIGWRLTGPFVMLLALVLALPLSQVNPRQGRYIRLFPAIMIFASLIVAVMAVKARVAKGGLGIWAYPAVMVVYVVVGLFLSRRQRLSPQAAKRLKEAAKA